MPQRWSVDSTQGCLLRAGWGDLWDNRTRIKEIWEAGLRSSGTHAGGVKLMGHGSGFTTVLKATSQTPSLDPYASWPTPIHQPIGIVTTTLLVVRSEKLSKDLPLHSGSSHTLTRRRQNCDPWFSLELLRWLGDNAVLRALLHLLTHREPQTLSFNWDFTGPQSPRDR